MHRKSIEAAEHLKEQDNCNSNSDHEETVSMRTEASDASGASGQQQHPAEKDPQVPAAYPEDPEAFRNNSIACLRAKAQEHSAKLLNHGLMLQVRSNLAQQSCDANANNLHQKSGAESSGMF